MVTGDGAYIKKINKSLILQNIIEHQAISRADLSKITGLNKATISVQVADLLENNLIYETKSDSNSIGRRPILLSLNKDAGYVLGIDFDYKEAEIVVSNLLGNIVESITLRFETTDYDEIILLLAKYINDYSNKYDFAAYQLICCVLGIHGTVDMDEKVQFVPKYQWSHTNMRKDLEKAVDIPIIIENNVNLSAFAEKVYHYHQNSHVLSINLSSGIGAGNMVGWEMSKGYHGFAGEMGHMIISPIGPKCTCGNNGCWELYASDTSILNRISEQLNNPEIRLKDVEQLIQEKNPRIEDIFKEYLFYIAIGLNNIINLFNPGIVVLNSRFLTIYPDAIEIIKKNLQSNVSSYENIVLSRLGKKACVIGACALGIQRFLSISKLCLTDENVSSTK